MSRRKDKYFIVDGELDVRFAVSGANEESAKRNAERTVKNLLETGLMGSCGWNFDIKRITETKPIH